MRWRVIVVAAMAGALAMGANAAEPSAERAKPPAKSKAQMPRQYADPVTSWGHVETTPSRTAEERDADKAHARLKAWVGRDIDELVKAWGPPKSTHVDGNGSDVYVFAHSGIRPTPDEAGGRPVEEAAPIKFSLNFYCDVSFRVRANKRIAGWRYVGNNCNWDN